MRSFIKFYLNANSYRQRRRRRVLMSEGNFAIQLVEKSSRAIKMKIFKGNFYFLPSLKLNIQKKSN